MKITEWGLVLLVAAFSLTTVTHADARCKKPVVVNAWTELTPGHGRKHGIKHGDQNQTTVVNVTTQQGGGNRGGGGRGDWDRGGGGHNDWNHHNNGGWNRGPSGGDIIGGIAGGIIGGTISSWFNPPQVVVVAPPPPPPEGPTAWSPEWYDYCNGKYKSFDAKSGYFTGYDGVQHFCR
jgi:hypothetical protein